MSALIELIHLFCCKAQFRHALSIAEQAEIVDLGISDADHICYFIPIIVGVQAVVGFGALHNIQSSITTGEMESPDIMGQGTLTHGVDCFIVHLDGNIHFALKRISPLQNLLPNLLPFPSVVIGDMRNFSFSFQRF